MNRPDDDVLREQVRSLYGDIAREGGSCCRGSECDTSPRDAASYAAKLGYSPDDVQSVPAGADMGLGCGNPHAIASLKVGETVLDLGSGGGLDCFLAARQVGPEGRVIGVDMTPDMVSKARRAARETGYQGVEFRLGEIEHLPVADGTVDVILSNCVINLSPDKQSVFNDAYRVLRSGGRLAISDVVAVKLLPESLRVDSGAHCSCIGGAALVSDIEQMLYDAGFTEVRVDVKPESAEIVGEWQQDSGHEEYVRSAIITAVK
ncbi:MAG: arsenite methyltransferase [Dehalococcoidia bacterium]|nr:arsenite methyltransferase [Dehalococcoidia bacterium]